MPVMKALGASRGMRSSTSGSTARMQSTEVRFSEKRNDLTSIARERASDARALGAVRISATPAANRASGSLPAVEPAAEEAAPAPPLDEAAAGGAGAGARDSSGTHASSSAVPAEPARSGTRSAVRVAAASADSAWATLLAASPLARWARLAASSARSAARTASMASPAGLTSKLRGASSLPRPSWSLSLSSSSPSSSSSSPLAAPAPKSSISSPAGHSRPTPAAPTSAASLPPAPDSRALPTRAPNGGSGAAAVTRL